MKIPADVTQYIEKYRSDVLIGVDWQLAQSAIEDLVLVAAPQTRSQAHDLCTVLATFLVSPCGWDRSGAPDLRALLNDGAVREFAAGRGCGPGSGRVLAALQKAQRSAFGIDAGRPVSTGRRHMTPVREVGQVYSACTGLSFAAFAVVLALHTGKPASETRLRGLVVSLLATVHGFPAGTVAFEANLLSLYVKARDAELSEELVQTRATPAPNTNSKKGRESDRKAAARLRADRAAHRRATHGPSLADAPSTDDLPASVADAICRYRSQVLEDEQWDALRPLVQRLVVGCRPPSAVSARNVATIVVAFLAWVWRLPDRTDPGAAPTAPELLGSLLHEAYVRRTLGDGDGAH